MALARIFMNESLRPWLTSGLHHVLGSGEAHLDVFASPVASAQQTAPQMGQGAQRPGPQQQSPRPAPASGRAKPQPRHPQKSQDSNQHVPTQQRNPSQEPPCPPQRPQGRNNGPSRDPAWQQLAGTINRRSLVVWTYWELGSDLLGEPSTERRAFLKGLLQAMRLPKGNIAFWPLAVPKEQGLVPDAQWFWRGVSRFCAEQVCCFGDQAADVLNAAEGRAAQANFAPSVRLLRFPAVEDLAQLTGQEFMRHLLELMQVHKAL